MRLKDWRHLVEICAFAAAGIWACYVFIYEERIKPFAQPARLTISTTSAVHESGGYQLVTFQMKLHNTGAVTLDVAGEEITAVGMTIAGPRHHLDVRPPAWDVRPGLYLLRGPLLLSTGVLREGAAGGIAGRHIFLLAGESTELEETVVVRHRQFAAVEFDFTLVPGKAPIDPKIRLPVVRRADGSYDIASGPMDSGTRIVPL